MRSIHDDQSPVSSLKPQVATGTVNGATVDLREFDAAEVVIDLGAFGGTTPTATVQIQDSADASTWAAVTEANLVGGALPVFSTSNHSAVHRRGYIGGKRYLRAAITATSGTSPTIPICAVVNRAAPRSLPVT